MSTYSSFYNKGGINIDSQLYFSIGDVISINNRNYKVEGFISYLNTADNSAWAEYKLVETNNHVEKWLSIDHVYKEYALYSISSSQVRAHIQSGEYKQSDKGTATVMDLKGNVDVQYSDKVRFSEYEDKSEERIIAIEEWEDETEYSTGYYLDEDEISVVSRAALDTYDSPQVGVGSSSSHRTITADDLRGSYKKVTKVVTIVSIILFFIMVSGRKTYIWGVPLDKKIEGDSIFKYTTSITSDIDNKQKADVYETDLSIEEASKRVIELSQGDVQSVDESSEDGSVAIITSEYYCIIYTSDDGKTLVQVSPRKYVYTSRNDLYHAYRHTHVFYRGYYYRNAYQKDYQKYRGVNAFDNYDDSADTIHTTQNGTNYKKYVDTVRQESAGSRSSSGGGTNSGK